MYLYIDLVQLDVAQDNVSFSIFEIEIGILNQISFLSTFKTKSIIFLEELISSTGLDIKF
jgi:hypothetical protein